MGKRKHENSIDITGSAAPSSSCPETDVINLADDTPTPPGVKAKLTSEHSAARFKTSVASS